MVAKTQPSSVKISSALPKNNLPQRHEAEVISRVFLNDKVVKITAQTKDSVDFIPGQYASWLINNQRRPMSFANLPGENILEFLVDISPAGIASNWAKQTKPGEKLNFLAPYGKFVIDQDNKNHRLYIATGTGIAPIISHLLAENTDHPTTIIFGSRTVKDRFYDEELLRLFATRNNSNFIPVCIESSNNWSGQVGHVADVAIAQLNKIKSTVYICGGPEMAKETSAKIKASDTQTKIVTESFV